MATNREALEIENIRSGIEKTRAEVNKMMTEINKMTSEINKMIDESSKIRAETAKINRENKYYPLLIGSGITIAIGTFIGALIKLLLL